MRKHVSHSDNKEVVISITKLYKSFDENHVLRGIDLELCKGENLVVLGRSGTGKSVLIKIIVGLLKPDSGTVKVFDKEVAKLDKKELRELRLKIGFLFQHSALYDSMTIRENLEFPLVRNKRHISRKEIDESVRDVLEAVDLSDTINQLPSELSGGQQKRIGLARTLIMKPEIIFYDEPTAGLDPLTSGEINDLIVEIHPFIVFGFHIHGQVIVEEMKGEWNHAVLPLVLKIKGCGFAEGCQQ